MRLPRLFLVLLFAVIGRSAVAADGIEPFTSTLLGRRVPIALHVPSAATLQAYRARHPGTRLRLVLFLPGAFDGPGDLLRRGVFAELARREEAGGLAPSLWVAVTHYRSWYADRPDGRFPYARFLAEELVPALERRFPDFGGEATSRSVAGNSMGGFGALNLCGRTRLFSRALALSPALVEPPFAGLPWFIRWSLRRALPTDPAAFAAWSPRVHTAGDAALRLAAGTEDRYRLAEGVRTFADMAARPGRSVELFLGPGGHDWTYWTAELRRHLDWLAEPVP